MKSGLPFKSEKDILMEISLSPGFQSASLINQSSKHQIHIFHPSHERGNLAANTTHSLIQQSIVPNHMYSADSHTRNNANSSTSPVSFVLSQSASKPPVYPGSPLVSIDDGLLPPQLQPPGQIVAPPNLVSNAVTEHQQSTEAFPAKSDPPSLIISSNLVFKPESKATPPSMHHLNTHSASPAVFNSLSSTPIISTNHIKLKKLWLQRHYENEDKKTPNENSSETKVKRPIKIELGGFINELNNKSEPYVILENSLCEEVLTESKLRICENSSSYISENRTNKSERTVDDEDNHSPSSESDTDPDSKNGKMKTKTKSKISSSVKRTRKTSKKKNSVKYFNSMKRGLKKVCNAIIEENSKKKADFCSPASKSYGNNRGYNRSASQSAPLMSGSISNCSLTNSPTHSVKDSSQSAFQSSDMSIELRMLLQSHNPIKEKSSAEMKYDLFRKRQNRRFGWIKMHLLLIIHVKTCHINKTTIQKCNVKHCNTMLHVFSHLQSCSAGKNCSYPHCYASLRIMKHCRSCIKEDCPVCVPVKRAFYWQKRYDAIAAFRKLVPPRLMHPKLKSPNVTDANRSGMSESEVLWKNISDRKTTLETGVGQCKDTAKSISHRNQALLPCGLGTSGLGTPLASAFEFEELQLNCKSVKGSAILGCDYGISHQDDVSNKVTDAIIMRNLPISFTWQNLRDRFRDIGEVRFIKMKDLTTAIIKFFSEHDAQHAIGILQGVKVEGHILDVSLF